MWISGIFKVHLASITATGIDKTTDITLYNFSGGAWNELPTTYIGDVDSTCAMYNATVSHFSDFAVGGKAAPTPTPTPTPTAGGGNGGAMGGGRRGSRGSSAGTPPYIYLNATPAEITADGNSTSTITASVWEGDKWILQNLTVNFSTDLGDITASAAIVNGAATGIVTAGTEEGIANVTAEANLNGIIGLLTNTTTVDFTTPSLTLTPTPTVTVTVSPTPMITPAATPSPTPGPAEGIPGSEGIFAVAGLLAIAYLVLRRKKE